MARAYRKERKLHSREVALCSHVSNCSDYLHHVKDCLTLYVKMNDLKIQTDKQTGSNNWTKWKHQILLLFKCHGLAEIVTGKVPRPNVSTEKATAEQWKELEKFEKKDAQAQLLITNALLNEVYNMLGVIQTSNEAWQRLLSIQDDSE